MVGRFNSASQSTIQGDNAWTVVAIQHPLATTINSLKWSGIEEGDTLFIMDPSSATYPTIRKWRTVGGVSGWGRVVAPLLQDADLAVGQAMVINKKSPGTATVSFE